MVDSISKQERRTYYKIRQCFLALLSCNVIGAQSLLWLEQQLGMANEMTKLGSGEPVTSEYIFTQSVFPSMLYSDRISS